MNMQDFKQYIVGTDALMKIIMKDTKGYVQLS